MTGDNQHSETAAPNPALPGQEALGSPQIAIDLPASADGASFRAWQGHLTFACSAELVDPDDAAAFHASTELYSLRQFIICQSTTSHRHRLVRTGEDVARTGVDHLQVSLHVEGSYEGRCGNRPFHAGTGDISFIDYGLPFDFEVSPYRTISFIVPRSAMPDALRQSVPNGLVPDAGHPATRLLAGLMRDSYSALPGLTLAQGVAAARAIVELAAAVSQAGPAVRGDARPAELDLFGRAQALIEQGIGNDALSADTLAQGLNCSRAALYGVFTDHGGVQAYVRERRLQRCYEIINGNDRAGETIGVIAFSLGFRSEAHFSRSFRARFGLAPRELRAVARERGVSMMPPQASGVAPDRIQTLGR